MPKPFQIPPQQRFDLATVESRVECTTYSKKTAYKKIAENAVEMADLTRRLYAENKRSLLLVLQGMDAAGKDGTIRSVVSGVNPRSCQVHSFKRPSEVERDHEFLWRVHSCVPRRGNIAIFNRSHYEDVLVVRVHDLVPKSTWEKRYQQINDFERLLAENGTKIIKCYLHVSHEEQRERLQERMDTPEKHWKVNLQDLEERKHWQAYREAFNDALTNCNTVHAPWYVVPSDRKWYRNLVVSELMLNTLKSMDPHYPLADDDYRGIVVE